MISPRDTKANRNLKNINNDYYLLEWEDIYELTMNRVYDADKIIFGYWDFAEFCKTNYPEWYNKSLLFKIPNSKKYRDINENIKMKYHEMVNELKPEYYY